MGAHPGFGSSGGGDSMENDGKMCDEVNKGDSKLILNGSYDTPIKVSEANKFENATHSICYLFVRYFQPVDIQYLTNIMNKHRGKTSLYNLLNIHFH